MLLYATSVQDVHGLGIDLSNLGPTNRVDQKRRGRKRVYSSGAFFYHSVKATFDLLDTLTAPDVLQSLYSHVSHKRI